MTSFILKNNLNSNGNLNSLFDSLIISPSNQYKTVDFKPPIFPESIRNHHGIKRKFIVDDINESISNDTPILEPIPKRSLSNWVHLNCEDIVVNSKIITKKPYERLTSHQLSLELERIDNELSLPLNSRPLPISCIIRFPTPLPNLLDSKSNSRTKCRTKNSLIRSRTYSNVIENRIKNPSINPVYKNKCNEFNVDKRVIMRSPSYPLTKSNLPLPNIIKSSISVLVDLEDSEEKDAMDVEDLDIYSSPTVNRKLKRYNTAPSLLELSKDKSVHPIHLFNENQKVGKRTGLVKAMSASSLFDYKPQEASFCSPLSYNKMESLILETEVMSPIHDENLDNIEGYNNYDSDDSLYNSNVESDNFVSSPISNSPDCVQSPIAHKKDSDLCELFNSAFENQKLISKNADLCNVELFSNSYELIKTPIPNLKIQKSLSSNRDDYTKESDDNVIKQPDFNLLTATDTYHNQSNCNLTSPMSIAVLQSIHDGKGVKNLQARLTNPFLT